MRRDVFQAIADPTRREIIGLLAAQPQTPNALAENFAVSRQAISKHIRILTDCGLLALKIEGREYYYSIEPARLTEVADWLEPFRKLWEDRFTALDEVLKKTTTQQYGKRKKNNHHQ